MEPVKMLYRNSPVMDVGEECLVYAIHHTHDAEGYLNDIFATAWSISKDQWISAPIYCFTPILPKTLNE